MRKGFTLAEVLVTLTIIGVLAAMTIPSLIAQQEKVAYVTALKKFYSEFNSALQMYTQQNGSPGDLQSTGIFDTNNGGSENALFTYKELKPFLNIVKSCGYGYSGSNGCSPTSTMKGLSGNTAGLVSFGYFYPVQGVTANGVTFGIQVADNACGAYEGTYNHATGEKNCAAIIVDINGPKGPNQTGRDVFYFEITNKGNFYPDGGITRISSYRWNCTSGCNSDWTCLSTANTNGVGCAGRIVEQNWQMNY